MDETFNKLLDQMNRQDRLIGSDERDEVWFWWAICPEVGSAFTASFPVKHTSMVLHEIEPPQQPLQTTLFKTMPLQNYAPRTTYKTARTLQES